VKATNHHPSAGTNVQRGRAEGGAVLSGRVEGGYVTLAGERFYRIGNVDAMAPFLMSVVSASDLWMFVSSSGGLTAGRVDADHALFPYDTDDRVTENSEHIGPKTILRVRRGAAERVWEPFSVRTRGSFRVERNLYKSLLGDEVVFEEHNHDLGLRWRYGWRGSAAFGFVRSASLSETSGEPCQLALLDGLQHLLPAGVTASMQSGMSNLVNAYKRSELEPQTGLGLFALSSILTDLAEPSESLRATTVAALGLPEVGRLLSSQQLDRFRHGAALEPEHDVRGRRGAYFVHADIALAAGETRSWRFVADVGQDHAQVQALVHALRDPRDFEARLDADLRRSRSSLAAIVASAGGMQWTADALSSDHHLASVMFNVMRGGVFVDDHRVERDDLIAFVRQRNRALVSAQADFFAGLPERLDYAELVARAAGSGESDLERLCRAYLPLAFSRRHGDPSRPWNRFAINVRHPDGRLRLDYQGNWRDIFQNWEALAYAFPGFLNGMITTFLSATTVDGYNPYRVTRDGIEWEVPEPGHAWANIGYWSDHQIIYLQKLLEASQRFDPAALEALVERRIFSHADVPYRIAPYQALLDDPYDTISFDVERDRAIAAATVRNGTDARLVRDETGAVVHVSLAEKLLLLVLVKLASLVPGGGIWMHTQRPEWNDANNALVGKGLSVVTVAYLYRTVRFAQELLAGRDVAVARELGQLFDAVATALRSHAPALAQGFDDQRRRACMDALGQAASDYRTQLYQRGPSREQVRIDAADLRALLDLAGRYLEHTLRANRRGDALYHAYNVLTLAPGQASLRHLDEMLEGQVAVLSSGLLTARESLELLTSLRHGRLYRADQHSYLLYPDRDLPGFLAKNRLPREQLERSALLQALVAAGDRRVVVIDDAGEARFHADFRNAKSVRATLATLATEERWADMVAEHGEQVVALYEQVFDHDAFTGRSGTFFGYEGLGSIYWHMVSKLLLAVQETYQRALTAGESPDVVKALAASYHDVRAGLGFHKSPDVFGAFPADPYSHTPAHAGAQQPGMTGQVKEDVLARWGELGVSVEGGRLTFAPTLVARHEFQTERAVVRAPALGGATELTLEPGSLGFTFCQVPVVYRLVEAGAWVEVYARDGNLRRFEGASLDAATSREVFERSGTIERIEVAVEVSSLVVDVAPPPVRRHRDGAELAGGSA